MVTIKYNGRNLGGNEQTTPESPVAPVRLYDMLTFFKHTFEPKYTRTKLPTHYLHFEKPRCDVIEDIFGATLAGIRAGDFRGYRIGHIVANGSDIPFEVAMGMNPVGYLKEHPDAFKDQDGSSSFSFYEGQSLDACLALFAYNNQDRSGPPRLEIVMREGEFDLERAKELIKPVIAEAKRDQVLKMIERSI